MMAPRSQLVCLHGWGMTSRVWQPVTERLSGEADVFAPDLPGHGDRGTTPPSNLEEAVGMIADVAPRRSTVIGWSLGATIALAWALYRPEDVERLILIGATPCFVQREGWSSAVTTDDFSAFKQGVHADAQATLRQFCALQATGDKGGRNLARELATSISKAPSSGLLWGLDALEQNDLRLCLGEITQPVLLIHGANDALVPLEAAEVVKHQIAVCDLKVVAAAGHAPLVSAPDSVVVGVREFLHA